MKLGLGAVAFGPQVSVPIDTLQFAESLGYDSAWTPEAYGNDAVSTAAWVLAQTTTLKVGTSIMQMPARTPAMTAMTAMTLDQLSGGRFILGLGASGPQVVEGWHGVPYGRPITRTREYVEIVRKVIAREGPLTHHGHHYEIPATGPGTTGLAKPLKSILHGSPIPIYTASISPAGLRCAGEVADGIFPLWMNPERFDLLEPYLAEGFAKAGGGKGLDDFAICPGVTVVVTDDVEKGRMPAKANLALYIGGMGARDKNFYNDFCKRLGYEEAAVAIQDYYLDGKRNEAMAAVPDELIDELFLIGPRERIIERLGAWKQAGQNQQVHTMMINASSREGLELMAQELL
jgi:F420-dependent oxidoreductase-like protein